MRISSPTVAFLTLALSLAACGFDTQGTGQTSAGSPSADPTDADTDGSTGDDEPDEPAETEGAEACDSPRSFFRDADEDGFGDPSSEVEACEAPAGYVEDDGDCDDTTRLVHPDVLEQCDGQDNDCDGGVDEFSSANETCGSCTWGVGPGGSHAYAACSDALSWDDARQACLGFAGDLAVVSSAPTHAYVHQMGAADRWIGLADRDEEGRWVWVDGEEAMIGGVSVGFDGWQGSQPDGATTENCGLLVHSRGWADVDCEQTHPFACQLPL